MFTLTTHQKLLLYGNLFLGLILVGLCNPPKNNPEKTDIVYAKFLLDIDGTVNNSATPVPTEYAKITFKRNRDVPSVKTTASKTVQLTDIITDPLVLEFLSKNEMLKRAYHVQQQTGIKAATCLAQKGLESNWGQSTLTRRSKNLGNIKCTKGCWKKHHFRQIPKRTFGIETPHCIQYHDDSWRDSFIKMPKHYSAWSKYTDLIKSNGRYRKVRAAKTIKDQCTALGRSGYATDKKYGSKLWKTVQDKNFLKLQEYIERGYTITTTGGKYILLQP